MPITKARIGDLDSEYGTAAADETGFTFAGPNVDAVKAHVKHWAYKVGQYAPNDEALRRITPEKILQAMVDADQGRVWTVDASDEPDEPTETEEEVPPADGEEATEVEEPETPEPTANVGADDGDEWVLEDEAVGNVFCATGPGGGVDPSCSTGGSGPAPVKVGSKVTYRKTEWTVTQITGGRAMLQGPNGFTATEVGNITPTGGSPTKSPTPTPTPTPKPAAAKTGPSKWDKVSATVDPKDFEKHVDLMYSPAGTTKVDVSKVRDKSVHLRDRLPADQRDAQVAFALAQWGLSRGDVELKKVKLSDVKPTQHGEDRLNDSSRASAKDIATGDLRRIATADLSPVLLNPDMSIRDGNHRFTAAELNGQEYVYALVPKG